MAGEQGIEAQQRPDGSKATLRAWARARRAAISEAERADAETRVAEHLLALPELATTRVVVAYAAFGHELSVDGVAAALLARGVTVGFPRVHGDRLDAVAVGGLDELAPGWGGVREPPERDPLDLEAVDAVLVPALAFDERGHRLGYGGGHFDRFLARLAPNTVRIGVGFHAQLTPELPDEPHDQAVHLVVTESTVARAR